MKRKVDSALKNKQTVADMFNAVLQAHPNKEAIVFVDKQDHLTRNTKTTYTYAEVEAESNKGKERMCRVVCRMCVVRVRVCRVCLEINCLCATPVANWALSIGLKEKDVVALMMDNRPEFIFMWYAPRFHSRLTVYCTPSLPTVCLFNRQAGDDQDRSSDFAHQHQPARPRTYSFLPSQHHSSPLCAPPTHHPLPISSGVAPLDGGVQGHALLCRA